MIYLDNSATTFFKPPEVINAVCNTLKFLSVNGGRGSHRLAQTAEKLVFTTRKKIAKLLNCDSSRVIFTSGCTEALNLAILGSNLSGNVVTTVIEHNSVLRPLNHLKALGKISITYAPPDEASIMRAVSSSTKMIAVTHVSNVTGKTLDIESLGKFCYKKGIIFLVDCAQSLGYKNVDMQQCKITFLAGAPHKGLHAMQGIGFLALAPYAEVFPIKMGGTGTSSLSLTQPKEIPEGLESGTLNTPGIASLCAAIDYTNRYFDENYTKLRELKSYAIEQLKSVKKLKIYSDILSTSGIISFNIENYTSMEVGEILNEQYDIAVRSGLHCAPLTHKYYGTEKIGMVRVSLGVDNTYKEIDFLTRALREISAYN